MCLIIANPTGATVPDEYIKSAYTVNDDGFGIMYANHKQELRIIKNTFDFKTVKHIFDSFHRQQIPYVAHFRMATHGTRGQTNCHPFMINSDHGGVAMVHNGVLHGLDFSSGRNGMSDTAILVEKLQNHISANDFMTAELFEEEAPVLRTLYGGNLGSDKLVFMAGTGHMNIYNQNYGDVIDGVWYSNTYSISGWGSTFLGAGGDELDYAKWFGGS